jgi:hypothetical protein
VDLDAVIQTAIAIAFVFLLLAGSGKKKPRRKPGDIPRRAFIPDGDGSTSSTEMIIREALGLAVPDDEEPAAFPEVPGSGPRPLAEIAESFRREDTSLEVGSSPAEQAQRHQEFHRQYVDHVARVSPPPAPAARKEQSRKRERLREAVIWSEILRPPKGLE